MMVRRLLFSTGRFNTRATHIQCCPSPTERVLVWSGGLSFETSQKRDLIGYVALSFLGVRDRSIVIVPDIEPWLSSNNLHC